ncbi:MAG: type II toxin-antitoxin system VapC family toxin [Candidatus Eremiobacterota bacterium]
MRLRVLDAGVAAKWVLQEPDSDRAAELLDAWRAGEVELIAPDLLLAEVGNVLYKRCHLMGQLEAEEAERGLQLVLQARPELVSSEHLVESALELALRFGRSVYDCLYVALALRERCNVITADLKLVAAMGPALQCFELIGSFKRR